MHLSMSSPTGEGRARSVDFIDMICPRVGILTLWDGDFVTYFFNYLALFTLFNKSCFLGWEEFDLFWGGGREMLKSPLLACTHPSLGPHIDRCIVKATGHDIDLGKLKIG